MALSWLPLSGCSTAPAGNGSCPAGAPGEDGPLFGVREAVEYRDDIYIGGFGDSCHATRARKPPIVVPTGPVMTARVTGDAIEVLHTVVTDWLT